MPVTLSKRWHAGDPPPGHRPVRESIGGNEPAILIVFGDRTNGVPLRGKVTAFDAAEEFAGISTSPAGYASPDSCQKALLPFDERWPRGTATCSTACPVDKYGMRQSAEALITDAWAPEDSRHREWLFRSADTDTVDCSTSSSPSRPNCVIGVDFTRLEIDCLLGNAESEAGGPINGVDLAKRVLTFMTQPTDDGSPVVGLIALGRSLSSSTRETNFSTAPSNSRQAARHFEASS